MRLQTIVYVTDMDRAIAFYEGLGLRVAGERSPYWTPLEVNGATLALHYADKVDAAHGRIELSFVCEDKLETLAARLKANGIALAREISDEAFGRSLQVEDSDGLRIQINEHDTSL